VLNPLLGVISIALAMTTGLVEAITTVYITLYDRLTAHGQIFLAGSAGSTLVLVCACVFLARHTRISPYRLRMLIWAILSFTASFLFVLSLIPPED
jgi:hypothetical protein